MINKKLYMLHDYLSKHQYRLLLPGKSSVARCECGKIAWLRGFEACELDDSWSPNYHWLADHQRPNIKDWVKEWMLFIGREDWVTYYASEEKDSDGKKSI